MTPFEPLHPIIADIMIISAVVIFGAGILYTGKWSFRWISMLTGISPLVFGLASVYLQPQAQSLGTIPSAIGIVIGLFAMLFFFLLFLGKKDPVITKLRDNLFEHESKRQMVNWTICLLLSAIKSTHPHKKPPLQFCHCDHLARTSGMILSLRF